LKPLPKTVLPSFKSDVKDEVPKDFVSGTEVKNFVSLGSMDVKQSSEVLLPSKDFVSGTEVSKELRSLDVKHPKDFVSGTEVSNNFLTPIQIQKVPEGPDLRLLNPKSFASGTSVPKSFASKSFASGTEVPKSSEVLHHKLKNSNFIKSYNSLMNNLESEVKDEVSNSEVLLPIVEVKTSELLGNSVPEAKLLGSMDVKQSSEVLLPRTSPLTEVPKELSSLDVSHPKERSPNTSYISYEVFGSEVSEVILQPKTEDLDEDMIEIIKLSKKQCKVFTGSGFDTYSNVRANTDNLIFMTKNDMMFVQYSKQRLFDEYISCHKQLYFHLKITFPDDVEIFWIPMTQIVRILEYSHPVYEIEKTKFSMNLYSLIPIKLKA
jgi:hypothetical protein